MGMTLLKVQIRPWVLPSKSFTIHYSLIIYFLVLCSLSYGPCCVVCFIAMKFTLSYISKCIYKLSRCDIFILHIRIKDRHISRLDIPHWNQHTIISLNKLELPYLFLVITVCCAVFF
jgi:hypothetical protein